MFTTHTLLVFALAALVPLMVGFLWYNPKTFGNAWIKASKVREEDTKNANMALVFGLTYLFGFFLAVGVSFGVIHQYHLFSLVADQPDPLSIVGGLLETYKSSFRTFKHGAFHGITLGIFFALPVVGVSALFEGKGWKYILINLGYWVVTIALMGGIICQFA